MINPFNTQTAFASISEYWSPKIIGELNGQYIKIAKLKGEFTPIAIGVNTKKRMKCSLLLTGVTQNPVSVILAYLHR